MSKFKKSVDIVYYSYMKAQSYQKWESPDSQKRNPSFTKNIIQKYSTQNSTNILITGSKGKGSVATILSTLLQHNFKVGLTTSPHITEFNDRFKVNSSIMTQEEFIALSESIKDEVYHLDSTLKEGQCISPIGIQAVIALKYFAQHNTQINIFECGKGVKYDDINNIPHSIAILNTVFLEHTRELGSTVLEILQDKLAIVTAETTCLYVGNIAKHSLELVEYIKTYVSSNYLNCTVKLYGEDFHCNNITIEKAGTNCSLTTEIGTYSNVSIPLYGEHQAENTALALAVYHDITGRAITEIELNTLLNSVAVTGRLQILKHKPLLILDTCINRESCKEVVRVLDKISSNKRLNFIICIPDDKDYTGVAEQVNFIANKIILTKTKNDYYKFSPIQQEKLRKLGIDALYKESITLALSEVEGDCDCCILCTTGLLPELIQ